MGRHTKLGQPDDEPAPDARASQGPYYGAPPAPPFDAYSGPADDRLYVSPHETTSTGPAPGPEYSEHPGYPDDPPYDYRFEPLPGDYPDASGAHPADPPDPWTDPSEKPGGRGRLKLLSVLPVPMLPIVALVIAVGIVAYALSTQQISLNFAGGAPARDSQPDPRDNQVSQRGPGERASRGAGRTDGLVVAFRVASRKPGGFAFTATIANKGPRPVAAWALAFKIDSASVTAVSGAAVVRTGKVPFVRGRAAIAPGATVRVVFAARGTPAKPSTCVMNSRPCVMI
ncbi:cellulose binding domain-containing protein [Actinomadura chibensis]|uniref:CBM2 domain-containing protein n=1 Tax=Actinomadura chibensis TaxID=392828 RepID=A0A5D0NGG4_9ACTN|nr:cellulose binding domain-containing protein [Actinomadura chibensis]TYB43301.1 hypothetical protein FXF69_26075 [Actinomadura chibensis]